jgi:hypothetical protein
VPTKKQRRRQQKSRRHEWEYVYVDDEGQEVEVDPAELRAAKKTDEKERPRAGAGPAPRRTDARGRPVRQVQPPSWRRVFKRALIFVPIFAVVLLMLDRNGSIAARVAGVLPPLVIFIPFMYFTDWLTYRTYQKRIGASAAATSKPSPKPKTR